MVTVRDLLAQPVLGLRPVVSGPDAPVRWVATSELADPVPFLEGGEVLLTTGMAAVGWTTRWDAYVHGLRAAGVVALGLGTGLTHPEVPAHLERACREQQLTLFEVPRRTTFVAISRRTARMLSDADRAASRRAMAMQRELTEAAASGHDDGAALLKVLAAHLDGGAALLDAGGRPDLPPTGPLPSGLDLAEEVRRLRARGPGGSAVLDLGTVRVVLQPVGVGTRGYLALWSPSGLDAGQRAAVTTTVALLALFAQRRADRLVTGRRVRARAVELLFAGDPRTADVLASADDPGARLPREVRAVQATGDPAALDEALAAVESRYAQGTPGHLLAAVIGERLHVVGAPEAVEDAVARLQGPLRVGVGGRAGIAQGRRAVATARHALAQTTPAVPRVRWDDLTAGGVLTLVDDDAQVAFARSYLAPVAARGELLDTLRAFLRHHGSRGRVAADLAVHRNTIRHRVAEIERLLGRSLDDPATRANAWVALQTLDIRDLRA